VNADDRGHPRAATRTASFLKLVPYDPRPGSSEKRKLIARIFDYLLDCLIPKEDTELFQFCRGLPGDPSSDAWTSEFEASAEMIMTSPQLRRARFQQVQNSGSSLYVRVSDWRPPYSDHCYKFFH
jgi:hypothetical protein